VSRTKALLKLGLWPPSRAPNNQPTELTPAARTQGLRAIEELGRLGVSVRLEEGKARFRSLYAMPSAARRIIEVKGDLIEASLKRARANPGGMKR
jgi:hypothetical protein